MSDAAAWDERYASGGFAFGAKPNLYLEAQAARLRPGMRALAIGDGEGRNGVWLAERRLLVTSVDWSAAGLAKASALANARGVSIRTVVADLVGWDWPVGAFDLVAWIFVHLPPKDRAVVAARAVEALSPGGLLVLEGFTPAQEGRRSGGPRDSALLWSAALVREHFAGLELLECLEGTVLLDEGPKHQGHAEVVRALLRKA
ncbi:SAM-dependent methyltransferase [Roseomonas xinghualingensis]|uniref:SAM-dependent methyltransferase n=1 Tax=Roseomonas xinghualingensis TaxID=2986475 RepID=UPI0021F114F6|nr:class I SAM-dependent methyltransferase [Roseomonas sp. SXEYE001]MCV4206037.1 class I SAM-dependent methyltransferase [Roseomonas sp. SXEYE001]